MNYSGLREICVVLGETKAKERNLSGRLTQGRPR